MVHLGKLSEMYFPCFPCCTDCTPHVSRWKRAAVSPSGNHLPDKPRRTRGRFWAKRVAASLANYFSPIISIRHVFCIKWAHSGCGGGGHYPPTQHNCRWGWLLWAMIGILGMHTHPGRARSRERREHNVPHTVERRRWRRRRRRANSEVFGLGSRYRQTRRIQATHNYQLLKQLFSNSLVAR